jgi:choline dehydrogenase-like flavoprotein
MLTRYTQIMVRLSLSSVAPLLFLPAALGGCGQQDIFEWDFVVIGGGTAGITLAARLAENSFKVALVEAGGYYEVQSLAAIPAAVIIPVGSDPNIKSPIDWVFVVDGMPGTNYRDVHYARGKCMGGS